LIHQAFASLDEPGGTRHYELSRYLVKKGHRVTIIASSVSYITGKNQLQTGSSKTESGITILRVDVKSSLHRSFLHRLFNFFLFMFGSFVTGMKVKDPDLVWGTSPPIFQGLSAWAIGLLKRKPFIFEVRDLWPDFAIAVGVLRNPILIWLSKILERFLYSFSKHVIVNSPGFIEHVKTSGAKHISLIPNGVDVEMFSKGSRDNFRRIHNITNQFVVMYAGAHGMSNDLGVVIDAAARLKSERDILFVFVGDGKDKEILKSQVGKLALENVRFIPSLPKREMSDALSAADICVAILKPLELYKTTYPNKVFDYMASGKPVLLAIDGVIREVVESADCGWFVLPGDPIQMSKKILELSGKPEECRTKGENGRNYVRKYFSREHTAGMLEELINQMTNQV
jgi:glycosyltransferase involved in cell wall biosynthesis